MLAGRDPKSVLDSGGLIGDLKKALAERMLNAEMDDHLANEVQTGVANHRNGSSPKTVLTPEGPMELSIPRDRHGRFDPALIAKYRRRFPGFDDKIIALYARGMSTRDIQGHVRELYGIEVSPDLVSAVTDQVIDEVAAWQARPLEPSYAIVFFDALRVKIRDEGLVRNKAVYLAIGMDASGCKQVLGKWIEQTEGAKFWLRVMNELRSRGTQDILIAVVDGLKPIYRAENAQAAERELQDFDEGTWGRKYPAIAQSWRRNWAAVIPFFAFPSEVCKIIYTTNAIESLNASVRKVVRNKGHFPSDQAATKLIWLALQHITENWKRPPIAWQAAKAQLAIQFGERFVFSD